MNGGIFINGLIFKMGSQSACVKGKNITLPVSPMIVNKRAMIPVRLAGEALGLDVKWDSKNRMLAVSRESVSAVLKLNSPFMVKSPGGWVDLGVGPALKGGILFVPANFFKEMGFNVRWDSKLKTIEIF
jgi:hypothetical protein